MDFLSQHAFTKKILKKNELWKFQSLDCLKKKTFLFNSFCVHALVMSAWECLIALLTFFCVMIYLHDK